jgi:NAD(P)H-dependent FMN reductase
MEKLFLPVLLGTTRPGRQSEKVAKLVVEVGETIPDIEVQLVDPLDYKFPLEGKNPEDKDSRYTELTTRADGFFIVTPEYNFSFPGSLKRMLDSEFENYTHKPVAFAGVSAGIMGGVRAIESLVPTTRKLGLVPTFIDVHFPQVQNLFDTDGKLLDEKYVERIKRSYTELIWLAKTLKWGRENSSRI